MLVGIFTFIARGFAGSHRILLAPAVFFSFFLRQYHFCYEITIASKKSGPNLSNLCGCVCLKHQAQSWIVICMCFRVRRVTLRERISILRARGLIVVLQPIAWLLATGAFFQCIFPYKNIIRSAGVCFGNSGRILLPSLARYDWKPHP